MSPYKNFEDQQRNQREYYQKNKEEKIEYSKQRHLINREENLRKMRERYKKKKGSTKQSLESASMSLLYLFLSAAVFNNSLLQKATACS